MYSRKKRYNKTLDEIGKKEYAFDFYLEKIVYKDLCCLHLTRKERKMRDKLKTFDLFREWKNSIVKKYKDTDKEKLIEFSRYLNQRLRNRESSQDYWKLAIPVILTLSITEIFSMLLQFLNGIKIKMGSFMGVILVSYSTASFMIFIMVLIWETMEPIWDSSTEKNFLSDFKEIIDELIAITDDERL